VADCWVISYCHDHLWLLLEGSQELEWNWLVEEVLAVWYCGFGSIHNILASDWIVYTGNSLELTNVAIDSWELNE